MKPEMGLGSFLERHSQSPRTRARLYYQGKMVTEGSVDATDLNYWIKHPFEFSDPILKPEYL